MFTDTYPVEDIEDAFYMVKGKSITVTDDNIQLAGANPSAEDPTEACGELGDLVNFRHILSGYMCVFLVV